MLRVPSGRRDVPKQLEAAKRNRPAIQSAPRRLEQRTDEVQAAAALAAEAEVVRQQQLDLAAAADQVRQLLGLAAALVQARQLPVPVAADEAARQLGSAQGIPRRPAATRNPPFAPRRPAGSRKQSPPLRAAQVEARRSDRPCDSDRSIRRSVPGSARTRWRCEPK